ncbi:MAG: T9SS type A sorting domain-containing protein [bacterium]|nr:T9SS type A sorting domain-containing protein [bacterium]
MRNLLLLFLLLPITLFAQDFPFRHEIDTIPVQIAGWNIFQPFNFGLYCTTPGFADLNGDGNLDLAAGEYSGNLNYFQNIGSPQSAFFKFVTTNLDSLVASSNFQWYNDPRFCDIDADGDSDLFWGNGGRIFFYRNVGTPTQFSFVLEDSLFSYDQDVQNSALADIDADGDLDIFCGGWEGKILFAQNVGTPQDFVFTIVSEQFQNINVGYWSHPALCDIDGDGDYDLFIGNGDGNIWFYRNDGTPQQYNFTLVSNFWLGIYVGEKSAPEFCDIDGDGDYDLFVGREPFLGAPSAGDVFFYQNVGTPTNPQFQYVTSNYLTMDVGSDAFPQLVDVDADGTLDSMVGVGHHIRCYDNIGTATQPSFVLVDSAYGDIDLHDVMPYFCDIDADGDYDVVAGTSAIPGPPMLQLFQNVGTPQAPQFSCYPISLEPGNFWVIIAPSLADIDGDGDLDLFITDDTYGTGIWYYENTGTPTSPNFVFRTHNWQGISLLWAVQRYLRFHDIDADGDLDLFFNNWEGETANLRYYRNNGTPQNPQMTLVTSDYLPFEVITPCASFCDIDADSLTDLFVGDAYGGILFFHGVDTTGVAPFNPHSVPTDISLSLFPNPSNAGAVVRFTLPGAGLVRVGLFDVEGRNVGAHCVRPVGEAGGFQGARSAPLQETWFPTGTHDLRLDAKDLPSGVYLIRLDTGQQRVTGKVVILK